MKLILSWYNWRYEENEHEIECPVFIPDIKDIVTTPDGFCGIVDYRHYNMQSDTLRIRLSRG